MTIRTLLVDDEPAAQRGLSRLLLAEPGIEIVATCGDGASAIAAISELKPDLVFLDIQMPGVNGFEVIDAIGLAEMPPVVFVTAFNEFALRAFDVHAIDYVLKPIDGERFHLTLDRVRQRLSQRREELNERMTRMLAEMRVAMPRSWPKRLAIKLDGRIVLIETRDIDRIESSGNYAEVHAGGKHYLMREAITHLGARLDPGCFARVSRSSIVNIQRVRELQTMFNGDFVVVLRDGTEVKGSRRYRDALDTLIS